MRNDLRALCDAACRGDLATINLILDLNPALVTEKHEGATPLHFAAIEGQGAAAELLLQRGADIDICDDEFGSPPAGWANEKGQEATLRLLVARGARMSARQAAAWGFPAQLEALLRNDPDALNRVDGFGTPLHEAVIWGRTLIVSRLLELGADAHAPNRDGKSAMALAREQASEFSLTTIVPEPRRSEIRRECARIVRMLERGSA